MSERPATKSEHKARLLHLVEDAAVPVLSPEAEPAIAPGIDPATETATPAEKETFSAVDAGKEPTKRRQSGAELAIEALEGCQFYVNRRGKAFIETDAGELLPLNKSNSAFIEFATVKTYAKSKGVVGKAALGSAVAILGNIAKEKGAPLPDDGDDFDDENPAGRARGGAPVLQQLGNCPVAVDPLGQTFIEIDGEMLPLDAKNQQLAEIVAGKHYALTGQTLGREAMAAAVLVLSHRARTTGEQIQMANRAAWHGGALWVNLGDRRAVKIIGGQWTIEAPPLGLFRIWSHSQPHPDPIQGGDASRLFETVNVSPDDQENMLYTLAAALVPEKKRPAFPITGPQGAGKSFTASCIKRLLDPANPLLTMLPRKPEDLDLMLSRNYCLALDNLNKIPPDTADILSGIITGAAPQRRKLHSDSELMTLNADVVLLFTGISALSNRPDFLERCYKFTLQRIDDSARRTDSDLEVAFTEAEPEILGGLYTLLAKGLELLPNYYPENLPRMAEFARIGAALAEAHQPGGGAKYLENYHRNQGGQYIELAETDSLFSAIADLCGRGEYLSGSFGEVAARLKEVANQGPKERPISSNNLRASLDKLQVALEALNISFKYGGRDSRAKAYVTFFAKNPTASTSEEPPVAREDVPIFDAAELGF